MVDVVLPRLSYEFLSGDMLEYKDNKLVEGQENLVEDFVRMQKSVNFKVKFTDIISDKVSEIKGDKRWLKQRLVVGDVEVGHLDACKMLLDRWIIAFLKMLDDIIKKNVLKAVKNTSKERCCIKDTVFNFSGREISEEIMNVLQFGSSCVVNKLGNSTMAREKLEKELMEYLVLYRQYIERKDKILELTLSEWLNVAIESSDPWTPHGEFYKVVSSLLEYQIGKGNRRASCVGFGKVVKFDELGLIVMEADKNCGLCIMGLEDVIQADQRMVEELGGVYTGMSEAEVLRLLEEKVVGFEACSGEFARIHMNIYYPNRMDSAYDSVLPFLKLKPKIHKLTEEEVTKKDISWIWRHFYFFSPCYRLLY